MSGPSTRIVPEVGRSSAPIRYSSVLLPEPDGPTMNVHDPLGIRNDHPAEGLDRLLSGDEDLVDVDGFDHGTASDIGHGPELLQSSRCGGSRPSASSSRPSRRGRARRRIAIATAPARLAAISHGLRSSSKPVRTG